MRVSEAAERSLAASERGAVSKDGAVSNEGAPGAPVPHGSAKPAPGGAAPLRVGIINIMPRAETYEELLLRPLRASALSFEAVWIRLTSHVSTSSDAEHLRRHYVTFDELGGCAAVDGLILTGAPVEELPFEDVRYFHELRSILEQARRERVGTLGLCWGGMAIGHLLGLSKLSFEEKLFGVFEQRCLDTGSDLTRDFGGSFPCAHSRHSGISDGELERASDAGQVRLLAHGRETGYSLFESPDGAFVAHLGHPEYPARRLLEEWERDTAVGRTDIPAPRNFDRLAPRATWQPHCDRLFYNWLVRIGRASTERERQPLLATEHR
jgi:homoserine O-succinyltransferase/O-acetyltransferase